VSRRVHTADDVLRHALTGATELVVAPGDLLTPLARDVAKEHRMSVVVSTAAEESGGSWSHTHLDMASGGAPARARLTHVKGAHTMPLEAFPVDLHRPEMDVRLLDLIGAEHGIPMAAGVMSLREGSFPWKLDYDEVEYVIEGELHITTTDQEIVGRPGDVIAVPKGSSISFGTPSWARFLYVTYPADWGGAA
jgi:ethanolamine utilization protein EutQ